MSEQSIVNVSLYRFLTSLSLCNLSTGGLLTQVQDVNYPTKIVRRWFDVDIASCSNWLAVKERPYRTLAVELIVSNV